MLRSLIGAGLVAATLAVSASAASAPVKRLAWNKTVAAWTAQAAKKHHAVTCNVWRADRAFLECVFYDPAVSPSATTFIKDGRHQAYGKTIMARDDRCTYTFGVYGADLKQARIRVTVDVCVKGWLARVPGAP